MEKREKMTGHKWWLSVTLKQKFAVFAGTVALTVGIAAAVNMAVANFAVYGFGRILDDNAKSYAFQEAVEKETEAFSAFMRAKTGENLEQLKQSCQDTEQALADLPFVYQEIGADRYAKTWSIRNSYEYYSRRRESAIEMTGLEKDYVPQLYEVYDMQAYLGQYARSLVQLTLQAGNEEYLMRLPVLNILPFVLFGLSLVLIIGILYLTRLMGRSVIGPIERLAHASRKIARNDFTGQDIAVDNRDEMGELVHAFNKMKHATAGYITTLEEKHVMTERLHQEAMERVEMEKILEATRLEVLKSQINPHFLFNTLNMIGCMAQLEEAETTEKMITSLSSLFRYNLKTTETEVPLAQELRVSDDYMYIQQMRFGERIRYEKQIQVDEKRVIIPSFSLQPIVENAIIHGLSKKEQGGKVCIRVWQQEEMVVISVADTGLGMDEARLLELRADCMKRKTSKIGIGLGNIYKRLHMMYEGAEVELYSRAGVGTIVQMKIPQKQEDRCENR